MRDTLDIAWLGGLLEGEASFMMKKGTPIIQMQMTDRDTIDKAALILGISAGATSCKPKGKETYLPVWRLAVHGFQAAGWMMTLYQFLGERRQAKVREVLNFWRSNPRLPKSGRSGLRFGALCHPDRHRCGGGLCRPCWMRAYRKRTGKNGSYYRSRAEAVA